MILSRNTRNRTISGALTTTTAAIIAGMSCRPNPLSRMAWIPFLLFYLVGILSGALGGYIAWQILQRLPESLTKGFGSYEKNN